MPGETLIEKAENLLPCETPNGTDSEWLSGFVHRLKHLGVFERAYLEIWAWAYWYVKADDEKNLSAYINQLL